MSAPDLTPRPAPVLQRRRRWGVVAFLALIVAALGFILYQGLANAALYFCNADEVGQRSECSGGKRFRLQGTVDTPSIERDGATLQFTVTYNGATIPVTYEGEPGGIFAGGTPVVVEGRMEGDTFAGDRILVKHTEQYIEDNPDRVPESTP